MKSSMMNLILILITSLSGEKLLACTTFPAGVGDSDLVVEFLADGSNQLKQRSKLAAGTAREGMLVFDKTTSDLKLCNGTAWLTVSLGATGGAIPAVASWGANAYGQMGSITAALANTTSPIRISSGDYQNMTWKMVKAGGAFSCGLRATDDLIFCWGENDFGQLGNAVGDRVSLPVPLTTVGGWSTTTWDQVELGYSTACGIRSSDKTIFCWGRGTSGEIGNNAATSVTAPTALDATGGWASTQWKSISGGSNFFCAIRASDDRIFCWGNNSSGQLGNGLTTASLVPTPLTSTDGFDVTAWKSVVSGYTNVCAIRLSDERLFCWGSNESGQLGVGTLVASNVPVPLGGTSTPDTTAWISAAVGRLHACAIRKSDSVMLCWGENGTGQLGRGTTTDVSTPSLLRATGGWNTSTWKSVAAAYDMTCGVRATDDRIYCWGLNGQGQLGQGTSTNTTTPAGLMTTGSWNTTTWKSVVIGRSNLGHTCGVRADDKIICWGYNYNGQGGRGHFVTDVTSIDGFYAFSDVSATSPWKKISAGALVTCGIHATSNKFYCWGQASWYLGKSSSDYNYLTAAMSPLATKDIQWKDVSVGGSTACLIRSDNNKMMCVGSYPGNGVGSSTLVELNAPADNYDWDKVSAGLHNCAIRSSPKTMYCWGANGKGQLGNGTTTTSNSPSPLAATGGWSTTEWKDVSVGSEHTCAIRADGRAFCWGHNAYNQFGNESTADSSTPTPISSTGGFDQMVFKSIDTGSRHSCAIRDDDVMVCWGANTAGQLGRGNTTGSQVPALLNATGGWDAVKWKSVSAGSSTTCAIRFDNNQLYCWGGGGSGQLGRGTTSNSSSPVALNSTGAWNSKTWQSVSVGSDHVAAIESGGSECDGSFSADYNSNDFFVQFVASPSRTRTGKNASVTPREGVLSYNRTSGIMGICRSSSWTPVVASAGASCSGYPSGVVNSQRVIEWRADGSGRTYNSSVGLRAAPRQGSMIYNSTLKALQVCNGTNWETITAVP